MRAKLTIYADHTRNKINKNIFGHFMEHSTNVIYGSVYDPQSKLADEDGFRTDVLETLRDVKVPMLRYPGGNFVSNYHWEDGVGPKENRPKVFDYAWHAEDDNRFGTIEFIKLCRKVGAEPYLCVNMGSGTIEEAMHWVEFCNGVGDTKYVRMRKSLGYDEPFNVKYWGLGNELYGDWQFGKTDAEGYASKALDFAKAMKWYDPSIELIACGYDISSDWNYIVVKKLKPLINQLALHHYSIGYDVFKEERYEECMYIPEYLTKLTNVARADIIAGSDDALTDIKIAWDEWNTHAWGLTGEDDDKKYDLKNTLLTALILHSFIRNSDVIELSSYSSFVNVCGAISVKENEVLKRSQYYVFKLFREVFNNCDEYIESKTECETYELEEVIDNSNRCAESKFALNATSVKRIVKTPYIDCITAMNNEKTKIIISIINKDRERDCDISVDIFAHQVDWGTAICHSIYHDDFNAANTIQNPNEIVILKENCISGDGMIRARKHSINIIELNI